MGLLSASLALASGPSLTCPAQSLHPGEKFTIKGLGSDHAGFTFVVEAEDIDYLVSFDTRIKSQFAPPISAEKFQSLTEVSFDTSTAVGIPYSSKTRRVLGPAKRIFTKSYNYNFVLTPGLDIEDAAVGACAVKYLAAPQDNREMGCPKQVSTGEKFTVNDLPPNHEGWILSISNFTTQTTDLLSFDARVTSQTPPPISPQELGKLSQLTIDTQNAVGLPFNMATHQVPGPAEPIFKKAGDYHIAISPRFATAYGPAKSCDFTFSTAKSAATHE